MPFYTLRPGQQCGHASRDLKPGEVIQLPVHVGLEVRDKLMPCTESGESLDHLNGIDLQIAQAAPHERGTLEAEKAAKSKPAPPPAVAEASAALPVAVVAVQGAPFARPVEPNQEVGHGQGPDPISTAPKTTPGKTGEKK